MRFVLAMFAFFMNTQSLASSLNLFDVKESYGKIYAHFSAAQRLEHHAFTLDNPPRFVIDFPKLRKANLHFHQHVKGLQLVKDVRSSESLEKLRLVFDLKQYYVFDEELSVSGRNLMVTLHAPSSKYVVVPKVAHVKKIVAKRLQKATPAKPYRPIIVVIDPGHGGKDPGASGDNHHKEKDIVLRIAKRLAQDLNQRFGFKALLTRNDDRYLSLRERLNLARYYNADMFVSIHADAYKNNKANGASVFALSERGATSEAARWLAERENISELMGGVKLDDKGAVLRSVLIDLSQTATTGASLEIGADVISELKHVAKLHKGRVEQAAFVVLKSPDIPSLLVETGFISNTNEAKNLSSATYQKKLAKAVGRGVEQYFIRRPMPGTILDATKKGVLKHVVVKGDNLSLIAKRYKTTVEKVRAVNNLKDNVLHVGQVLLMPKRSLR